MSWKDGKMEAYDMTEWQSEAYRARCFTCGRDLCALLPKKNSTHSCQVLICSSYQAGYRCEDNSSVPIHSQ